MQTDSGTTVELYIVHVESVNCVQQQCRFEPILQCCRLLHTDHSNDQVLHALVIAIIASHRSGETKMKQCRQCRSIDRDPHEFTMEKPTERIFEESHSLRSR